MTRYWEKNGFRLVGSIVIAGLALFFLAKASAAGGLANSRAEFLDSNAFSNLNDDHVKNAIRSSAGGFGLATALMVIAFLLTITAAMIVSPWNSVWRTEEPKMEGYVGTGNNGYNNSSFNMGAGAGGGSGGRPMNMNMNMNNNNNEWMSNNNNNYNGNNYNNNNNNPTYSNNANNGNNFNNNTNNNNNWNGTSNYSRIPPINTNINNNSPNNSNTNNANEPSYPKATARTVAEEVV